MAWYRSNVGALHAWLRATDQSTILADLTSETMQAYLAEEATRPYRIAVRQRWDRASGAVTAEQVELPGGLSQHSLNSKIRCLRAFGRWLVKHGWLVASPFEGLERAGAPKLRKKVLS